MTYEIATIGDLGAPCSCKSNDGMGELAPESEAVKLLTVGFPFPTVFPSDVDAYKARIDPDFRATDALVSRCAPLSSPDAVAWGDFFTEWQKFRAKPTPVIGSWETHLEQTKRFESTLHDWQQKLAPICGAPATPMISPPGGSIPWGKIVLGLAVVGVVGAVGYSFYKAGAKAKSRAEQGQRFLESRADDFIFGAGSGGSSRALARR